MIEVLGAPFDLCGLRPGSRMGPAALRMAGLVEALRGLGMEVADGGDMAAQESGNPSAGMHDFTPLAALLRELRTATATALATSRLPLVLGGEHTIAISGIASALDEYQGDLALLWIDAHADINTPATSATGNAHGMPVAALQGLPSGVTGTADEEWQALLDLAGPQRLLPERTAWFGLRDVDPQERARVKTGLGLSMTEIDRYGISACVDRFDAFVRASGARHLWVSFDVDALDPVLAPGTGTAVRGGLTYREAHLLAELLFEKISQGPYSLVGLDIVETNPLVDSSNSTAKMAVEWALSLFGKTVL